MVRFDVPEDIEVEDFYTQVVPRHFKEAISGLDPSTMSGKEFTLQFHIDEKVYCLRITDGKDLEMIEGGIEKPMLALSLRETDWREAVTGKMTGLLDRFTDPIQAADPDRYNKLLGTKGNLKIELKKDDGAIMPVTLIFNGEEKPEVTMKLDLSDWVAMQMNEVTGQALFMSGRLQAQGDMVFLMGLQALL